MNRVVLVHGLGVSPRYFQPLVEALPGAKAPDLRPATTLPVLAGAAGGGCPKAAHAAHYSHARELAILVRAFLQEPK